MPTQTNAINYRAPGAVILWMVLRQLPKSEVSYGILQEDESGRDETLT